MKFIFPRKIPSEIIKHIYEFCIDKRIFWNKVTHQFIKGGFYRKNLKLTSFIGKQNEYCRKFWLSNRPELFGKVTKWNSLTNKTEPCEFNYNGEWSKKTKQVVVTFITPSGLRNRYSGRDPVSKWLKNINKYETAAKKTHVFMNDSLTQKNLEYLPKEKKNFGIKFNSEFYKERVKKRERQRERQEEIKRGNMFIKKRKFIIWKRSPFIINYTTVNLLFTPCYDSYKYTFYKGKVIDSWFRKYRDDNNRLVFKKPRGKYKFDPKVVDNYIGEERYVVKFEDGDIRHYSIEYLLKRIIISKQRMLKQEVFAEMIDKSKYTSKVNI